MSNHKTRAIAWVAQLAAAAALLLGGRTLVLTTTFVLCALWSATQTAICRCHQIRGVDTRSGLQAQLDGRLRRRALDRRAPWLYLGGLGFILGGIDIPGEALQLVVIDNCRSRPGDPLVQARSERLQNQGATFSDYFVPEAAVAPQTGAGRLIRSETDRGILVVCDVRLSP